MLWGKAAIVSVAGLMVMVKVFVTVRCGVPLSVAATATEKTPACVGVPAKVRVEPVKVMPGGIPVAVYVSRSPSGSVKVLAGN